MRVFEYSSVDSCCSIVIFLFDFSFSFFLENILYPAADDDSACCAQTIGGVFYYKYLFIYTVLTRINTTKRGKMGCLFVDRSFVCNQAPQKSRYGISQNPRFINGLQLLGTDGNCYRTVNRNHLKMPSFPMTRTRGKTHTHLSL